MIDRLTPRSAILVTAALVLLVALVGWFAFVSPQRAKAAELADEITALETRLQLAERVISGDEPAERLVLLRRLGVAMPDEIAMPELLRQMSDEARSASVRIDGITPSAPVPTGSYSAVPISLAVDGFYFGIANFLEFLQSKAEADGESVRASGRLYSVDSISFGASGNAATTRGRVTATITLNAFTWAAGAPPAAAPPTAPTETPDATGAAPGTDG